MSPFIRRVLLAAAAVAVLAFPRTAAAWSRTGHMVHGAIAYQDLRARDTVALRRIVTILKAHPQYASLWLPQLAKLDSADHDIGLFMLAARWPDDVRDQPEYHHGTWHYTNYTFVPPGDTLKAPVNAGGDALIETEHNLAVLRDPLATDADKAIALCWIFHIVGDLHNPLHSVTIFSSRWPEGDRGGNLFWIRARTDARPMNLHAFWDGLIAGSDDFRGFANQASALRAARPREAVGALVERLSATGWAREEGIPLGVRWAYLDGKLPGGTTRETAETLPPSYAPAAKRVAEAQVTLAGYRLSALLARSAAAMR